MRLVGSLTLFLFCVVGANVSLWAGALAMVRLPTGLAVVVVLGTPLTLFLLPGLVLRSIKRRALREAPPKLPAPQGTGAGTAPADGSKGKEPPTDDGSLLGGAAVGLIIFGILVPLSLLFAGPASMGWIHYQSGEVLEGVTVDEAVQHPDAVYLSLKDAQVHRQWVGSDKYRVGRGDYTYYYAVPVVTAQVPESPTPTQAAPSASSKTKAGYEPRLNPLGSTGKGQSFKLWVGTTDKRQLDAIHGQSTFGGRIHRLGGDYAEAIDDAIRRHDLGAVEEPFAIELGAPTFAEAVAETQLSAWLGIGIFNLLFIALAGLMAFGRGKPAEPEPGNQ